MLTEPTDRGIPGDSPPDGSLPPPNSVALPVAVRTVGMSRPKEDDGMRVGRGVGALVASGLLAGGLALTVAAPPAGAAYASTGEPVWIPRNAANAADQSRADNRALARVGNTDLSRR